MHFKSKTVSAVKRTQVARELITNSMGCEIGSKYVVNGDEVPSEIPVLCCLVFGKCIKCTGIKEGLPSSSID